jgi:hypothetical protein
VEYYKSGGARGLPLEDQWLIDLGFQLGMMPDQILESDSTWVSRMWTAHVARLEASK